MSQSSAAGSDTGGMFAAIDAKDSAAFVSHLTDDAIFRFGSAPPVQGRDAIQAAVDGFFGTILGCAHEIRSTFQCDDTIICEGEVTYQRHDESKVMLPFADVLEYTDDLISHYKIYIDITPLYAE